MAGRGPWAVDDAGGNAASEFAGVDAAGAGVSDMDRALAAAVVADCTSGVSALGVGALGVGAVTVEDGALHAAIAADKNKRANLEVMSFQNETLTISETGQLARARRYRSVLLPPIQSTDAVMDFLTIRLKVYGLSCVGRGMQRVESAYLQREHRAAIPTL